MTRLNRFGWKGPETSGIARIVSAHGDYYHLVANETETGEILARKKKSAFLDPDAVKPITGDFVSFIYNSQGESMITGVKPRFSISRTSACVPEASFQASSLSIPS